MATRCTQAWTRVAIDISRPRASSSCLATDRRVLLPTSFCRECGQDYAVVVAQGPKGARTFEPRDLMERVDEDDAEAGYLYLQPDPNWADPESAIDAGLVPDDWLEEAPGGSIRIKSGSRKYFPERLNLASSGIEGGAGATPVYFIPGSFRLCLNCGVYYAGRQSDAGKLTSFGSAAGPAPRHCSDWRPSRPSGDDLAAIWAQRRASCCHSRTTGRMHRSRPDTSTIS